MNKLVVLLIAVLGFSAQANELVDAWMVQAVMARKSFAAKSDGTQIEIPGEYAISLYLDNDSRKQPTQRNVEAKVLPATIGAKGEIRLNIQTTEQVVCGPRDTGIIFPDIGPDFARTTVLTTAGAYNIVINGINSGSIVVDPFDGEVHVINFEINPNYIKKITKVFNARLAELTGDLSQYVSSEGGKTIAISMDEQSNFTVDYLIPAHSEDKGNGDVLQKAERKGHAYLDILEKIQASCEPGQTGKAQGWDISLTNKERTGKLHVYRSVGGDSVAFEVKSNNETLYFGLKQK